MRRGRPRHDDILTPREWEVVDLLREGLTNEQIAERLAISLAGAKYHVAEILAKLEVSSRGEAVAKLEQRKRQLSAPAFLSLLAPLRLGVVALVVVAVLAGVVFWPGLRGGGSSPIDTTDALEGGADLDPEVALALNALETAPLKNSVLLTKAAPRLSPGTGTEVSGLVRVSTIGALRALLAVKPDIRLIVLDESAANEPGIGDFLAHWIVDRKAVIQLNACVSELDDSASYMALTGTPQTVIEIAPDGTVRSFQPTGQPQDPRFAFCRTIRDANVPVFAYRREGSAMEQSNPSNDGSGRLDREFADRLDVAIRLFDSGAAGTVAPRPCPVDHDIGTPVPSEPDCP